MHSSDSVAVSSFKLRHSMQFSTMYSTCSSVPEAKVKPHETKSSVASAMSGVAAIARADVVGTVAASEVAGICDSDVVAVDTPRAAEAGCVNAIVGTRALAQEVSSGSKGAVKAL